MCGKALLKVEFRHQAFPMQQETFTRLRFTGFQIFERRKAAGYLPIGGHCTKVLWVYDISNEPRTHAIGIPLNR
ncbi:hypothetical protein GCM10007874_12160 [Labrys miyagiensis]|uniref:Uncharacterized protein n=1 Tax=Labrys miyagiensis TaxID=346912 RepID=A0ABQ6CDH8_9HYPH|nr:hypothetical protein GCM10007874_12160 [Labrys miyagiensis]